MVIQSKVVLKSQNINNSFYYGQWLAKPPEGKDVVISGISGNYPRSKDIYKFSFNLFNKVDMISEDQRFKLSPKFKIPKRYGSLSDIQKFDAGYFGIHQNEVQTMDVMTRLILEKIVESIFDAGVNPKELEGSRTGVFIASAYTERDKHSSIIGQMKSIIANRVGYFLKLKGPSFTADTGCSSSLYVLEHAYKALREGECDNAIVGSVHLSLNPAYTMEFNRLGVLSPDGKCKVFDDSADGYVRSEAVISLFLQKSCNARRIYAHVLHTKGLFDGFKENGIIYPSGSAQAKLVKEIYSECNINPADITYIEAHGTGTKAGDSEELFGIEKIFCKKRKTPLLLGSIKSNTGHTEISSGFTSLTKVIIAFETGLIPPNLHYKTPKRGVKGLEQGQLKVLTEPTPIADNKGLIGINSYGLGGANCHVLLRKNKKEKIKNEYPEDNLPRLVCVSGRKEKSIRAILDDIKTRSFDPEYISLYHQIFSKETINHLHRGYSIVNKSGELHRSLKCFDYDKRPLYLIFTNFFNNSWEKVAQDLFPLSTFADSINRINSILSKSNIDIIDILLNKKDHTSFDQILGSMAIQIGIADLFKNLKIEPKCYMGYGYGQLICGYFDGCLDLIETVLIVYEIAFTLHKSNDKFIHIDNSSNKIETNFPELKKKINEILVKLKIRSNQWLSTIKFKEVSTDHFLQNLQNCHVTFDEEIEESAIIYEIGNVNFSIKNYGIIDFLNFENMNINENYLIAFLNTLGILYEMGHNYELYKLYPTVQYPVSRGTPMISPLIKWNHSHDWFVSSYYEKRERLSNQNCRIKLSIQDEMWQFITDHNIDDRYVLPATAYLYLAWKGFSEIKTLVSSEMQIIIEDCRLQRVTYLTKNANLNFHVYFRKCSEIFEIYEGSNIVATGQINIPNVSSKEQSNLPLYQYDEGLEHMDLTTEDIYKELRIRGYYYGDAFQNIVSCNSKLTKAYIRWNGNWITFLDNMLQLKILQINSRNLYISSRIKRCLIDFKMHLTYVNSFEDKLPNLPVYIYKELNIIKCGGIEIHGIDIRPVTKRKIKNEPILQKYCFAPNQCELDLKTLLRVNTQILAENIQECNIKIVELYDSACSENFKPVSPIISKVVNDLALVKANFTILTNDLEIQTTLLDYPNINIVNQDVAIESDCNLIIGKEILQDIWKICGTLKENSFILTRQALDFEYDPMKFSEFQCITKFQTINESYLLLQRILQIESQICIKVSNENLEWIGKLQEAMKNEFDKIIIYAQNEPLSGILGLINCIRLEPGGNKIKCFFIIDSQAPSFDPSNSFYLEQVKKNLVINVYQNSTWGTYRHLLLNEIEDVECEHIYPNIFVHGDLSKLKWTEGPLKTNSNLMIDQELIKVFYSGLNFKDIMIATDRLNTLGFSEFSGCSVTGKRFMGMTNGVVGSTYVTADKYLMWEVPDEWSLEEAATVPAVYLTVLYSFFLRHKLKTGESILIHSGSGGIGQAAIQVALHYGCTVYTTVGTKEKREFIKQRFPQLTDEYIGNSRDTSFEQLILNRTNGHGVNVIVNSLSEEKLLTSIRCLATGGIFLEVGKFDFLNNHTLSLKLFEKGASFHGIEFDQIFEETPYIKQKMNNIFKWALSDGLIKPLHRTVFKEEELEKAFRYMKAAKHIGKVLIELDKEDKKRNIISPKTLLKKGKAQYYCDSNSSYVIVGGLGGFGLELANWLILRGAKNVILSSRKGISDGYQNHRIKFWRSYGCTVKISTADVTTKEGCTELIDDANKLAPISAIFNLAVVLKDALFLDQNIEAFEISFKSKVTTTNFLDKISRKLCHKLKSFVVFSSLCSGWGNIGQTNYGMSNSIIERICEKRKKDGLPAIAIQWGAIGEIGIVAEMNKKNIRGTSQQKLSNCLEVLDILLAQNESIVSSMVIAEKRDFGKIDKISEVVIHVLGIKDPKTINADLCLPEFGMDSLTAIEIKEIFERQFEVFLTSSEIRNLTFAKLIQLEEERNSAKI